MLIATEHAFKEKSEKLLILQPSEPFTFGHFNVRHPVGASQYCSNWTYPYLIIIPVIWFWHTLRFINVHLRFLLTLCKSDTCRTNWQTIPFICIVSHALLIYHSRVDPYMKSHSIFELSLIMFAQGIVSRSTSRLVTCFGLYHPQR